MMKKKKIHSKIILPTEKTIEAQNIYDHIIMLYGPPGIGKTEFMEKLSDSTFFISTDRGTKSFPALRWPVHNWSELIKIIRALEIENAGNKYQIICLDHIDDIAMMAEDEACETLGVEALGDAGYNKGWRRYKKNIWEILQRLLRLNTGIGLIAHETIKTIRTRVVETERTMPDLTKSAWKILVPKCDLVGYCGFKIIKQKTGKRKEIRIIRTSPLESIYAKDRTRRVQPESGYELLDGKEFAKTFERKTKHGKKKSKKKITR